MKALICTNEENEVVSVHLSTNADTLNERMRKEYRNERASLMQQGYAYKDVECEFNEGSSAHIEASDDYQYHWSIKDCIEI
jgi:hypothetical protein